MRGIKVFVGPHDRHHVGLSRVLDFMRVAGRDLDDFEIVARDVVRKDLVAPDLPQADDARACNNEEFLVLRLVPVATLHDMRMREVDGDLPLPLRPKEFCESAACICMRLERIGKSVFRQIAQIRAVKLLDERIAEGRDAERLTVVAEALDELCELSDGTGIDGFH